MYKITHIKPTIILWIYNNYNSEAEIDTLACIGREGSGNALLQHFQ